MAEVKKTLGINGSSIIIGGEAVRKSPNRWNAFLYSLFVSDWVGNLFVSGNQRLKSTFQELHDKTITLDMLLDISSIAERDLGWMVSQKLFSEIKAASRSVEGGFIVTDIDFSELDGSVKRVTIIKHPQYWEIRGEI